MTVPHRSTEPARPPHRAPDTLVDFHTGVDYTGLDFCALAGVEADASCGYGSATSPACDAGAQSLRPLRWAKKGAGFQGPTAWLGDSGWRQVFPWWLSVFFLKERSAIMREKPGDDCVWYDDVAEEERDCDA